MKAAIRTLSALLFALSVSAQAQQPKKVARIGYLIRQQSTRESGPSEAFSVGLRELGYTEGTKHHHEIGMQRGKARSAS